MKIPQQRSISFAPFLQDARRYSGLFLRYDLFAALSVALMTIPQSIAYSLLAGLPPTAGLFSAIFGTIFSSTFCSMRLLIAGPSTGTAILLQTAIAQVIYTYYPNSGGLANEALVYHILTQFVVVMGLVQVGSAFFNVSKLLQFVSRPVILGYFSGIAVAIAVTQSFSLTGIAPPVQGGPIFSQGGWFLFHLHQVHLPTLLVGLVSFGAFLTVRKMLKNWPHALLVLIIGTVVNLILRHWFGLIDVRTLANFQLLSTPIPELFFPLLDLSLISQIFPAALAIAFLAILEVFSITRIYAVKSGQSLQVNQDVFALGISNFLLSFLTGSMPTSGSATRTNLNFRLQAKTRFSAIFSAIFTAIIVLFCWPLAKQVPLATLGAMLIATAPTLVDFREIRFSLSATKADAWVFFLTFASCLFLSLDVAFFIGIVISIGSYLKKTATPHLVEYAFNTKGRLTVVSPKEDVHRKVRIIGIGGDLYFATADVFESALDAIAQDLNVQAIVLRLNNVHHMDASMSLAILHLHEILTTSNRYLVISGITEEVWHVFHRAGLAARIGLDNLYFTDETNPQFSTWKACLRAQELIHHSTSYPYF
ncbi:MAG TPA: SulP family inorganic anion transporter [Chlamydiales bacterium]|nr:SulP family inorganic anion transporter [Chlamydiales bacterium]